MDWTVRLKAIGRPVGVAVIAATLAVGCSRGTVAPSSTSLAMPSVTPEGPTAFTAWTERQGFGGSSGLRNVRKLALWLVDNRADAQVSDVASDGADVRGLISWLDAHPATPCWAAYHAAVTTSLHVVAEGYATAQAALASGTAVPSDVASAMALAAGAAFDLPAPASCP